MTRAEAPATPSQEPERTDGLRTLGRWSALVCAGGAIAYGALSVIVGATAPQEITYTTYARFVAEYTAWPTFALFVPPLIVALVFPVLIAALLGRPGVVRPGRAPLATLALVFTAMYSSVLGSAYWMQLTVVPWNIARGGADGLAPWIAWNVRGFFWSFESFGYFAMGLALLFAALALEPRALRPASRRGMVAMAALGAAFLVNMSLAWPEEVLGLNLLAGVGAIGLALVWSALFGFVAWRLAGEFGDTERHHR